MSEENTPDTTEEEAEKALPQSAPAATTSSPEAESRDSRPIRDPEAPFAEKEVSVEPSELEKARRETEEMKQRYLRSVADLENFRKRIAREKQDIIRSAAAGVIEELLPVIDNLKLGLEAADRHHEAKDVTHGFRMVYEQLKQVLAQQGLEELVPDGEVFNPNLHDCIAHQPSAEVPEDTVISTVRSGFRLNERLLRAANVIVSSGPDTVNGDATDEN